MASQEKNKIYIDKEALSALSLVQEGLLYPATTLMGQEEMESVNKMGVYKDQTFPCPFLLCPSGKRNTEVLSRAKKDEMLDIVCENKIVGQIKAQEVFKIDKLQRLQKLMGGDISTKEASVVLERLGDYAISGNYNVTFDDIKETKQSLKEKSSSTMPKKSQV